MILRLELAAEITMDIDKELDKLVDDFCSKLSIEFNMKKEEVGSLLASRFSSISRRSSRKSKAQSEVDMDDLSPERLSRCTLKELKALCRYHGHKVSGRKSELVDRLLGKGEPPKKKAAQKRPSRTKKLTQKTLDVVKKLTANIPVIPIRPNSYGNLEHPETRLVFDRKTETVIGRQLDDGTVADLTEEDIENCKRFKFKYVIPVNLDLGDGMDVIIDELDDSDVSVQTDDEDNDNLVDELIDDSEYDSDFE